MSAGDVAAELIGKEDLHPCRNGCVDQRLLLRERGLRARHATEHCILACEGTDKGLMVGEIGNGNPDAGWRDRGVFGRWTDNSCDCKGVVRKEALNHGGANVAPGLRPHISVTTECCMVSLTPITAIALSCIVDRLNRYGSSLRKELDTKKGVRGDDPRLICDHHLL